MGCTRVYHWHQNKHHRNASSLAYLPNSAFSPTDFKPLCKLFCCLRRTFLSGLRFCRSQYFNTLLLESFPFLILSPHGSHLWSSEHDIGRRLHIRIVSLLRSGPICECVCVCVLGSCFIGSLEYGVILTKILVPILEHFTLSKTLHGDRSNLCPQMISSHLAVMCLWSTRGEGMVDPSLILSYLCPPI